MYARISSAWWSGRLRGASDAACRLYCYLQASPHGNRIGLYRLPVAYIMEDLDWEKRKTEDTIKELTESGLIDYDWEGRCVFIPDYIELNSLKIGGREKAAQRDLVELPPTQLLHSLHRRLVAQGGLESFVEDVEEEIQRRRVGRTEWLSLEGMNAERKGVSALCGHNAGHNGEHDESIMPGIPRRRERSSNSLSEVEVEVEVQDQEEVGEQKEEATNETIDEIIDYLNEVSSSRFRHIEGNRKHIRARLSEGATPDDLKLIAEHKTEQWGDDPAQREYIRPVTLYGRTTKFDGYLSAAIYWAENGRPRLRGPTMEEELRRTKEWAEEAEDG